jgi:hypothetical protein
MVDTGRTACTFVAASSDAVPMKGAPYHRLMRCEVCGAGATGPWSGEVADGKGGAVK